VLSAGTFVLSAQPVPRRADIRGPVGERGRCVVEVVVDGVAEIDLRGDNAVMRDLGGAPPQWRRLECSSPIPRDPADFRFAGINGRGHQQLLRGPHGDEPAVVRIEDPQGGQGGYTFEITWLNAGVHPPEARDRDREPGDWHRARDEWARGDHWRDRIFERVREDLDQIQHVTWPGRGDEYRLERTKQSLNELQGQMARGHFDDRQLDEVLRSLDRVKDDNRLAPRDREILQDDIHRLRDLREHRR
jgi:hypothetical protein